MLVRVRHQHRAADAGLDVLFSHPLRPRQHWRQRIEIALEDVVDGHDVIGDAEVSRKGLGVEQRVVGGVPRGHRDASDLRGPQRLGCQRRGERRVDAAGQAKDDRREPALADVVAKAEPKRVPRLFLTRCADRRQNRNPLGLCRHIDDHERLFEVVGAQEQVAAGVEPQRVAVEDQLVVAADLIEVEKRHAMACRVLADHVAPDGRLAHLEGTRRDVHEQVHALGRQVGDRIPGIEPPRPEGRVVPCLLAHREAQAMALEHQRSDVLSGLEVAVFVEDVVRGQQRLAVAAHNFTAVTQDRRVEERLAARRLVGFGTADDDAQLFGGQGRDAIAQREVGFDES